MKRIFLILLLALMVRLVGINWGLPVVYHVDESQLVRSAMGMRFGDLNPHAFNWPSLYKYLCFFLFTAFIKLRVPFQILFGVETMQRVLPFWWGSTAPFYLLTRLLTAIFDVGSVAMVYLLGQKLFDRRVGLLAALVQTLNFASVYGGHYNRLEVPTTFLVLVSFYFAVRVWESGFLKDYLLAGLFAGLAASTKYNGALAVVSVFVASILSLPKTTPNGAVLRKSKMLLLLGLAAIAGFLLGTPYALLDYQTFLRRDGPVGFLGQVGMMGKGLNWHNIVTRAMFTDWGILMALLFLAGVFWAIKKHRPQEILLLCFPLLYFLYMGTWGIVGGHYALLLYPFLAILAANFVGTVWQPKFGQAVSVSLLCLFLAYPFAKIVENDVSGFRGDTRNLAYGWIVANIPFGSHLAIDGDTLPSYLGGSLPILPRSEDGQGYFLYPFEEIVLEYGRDWEKVSWEFKKRSVEFFITSSFVHNHYEDLTFYSLLDEKAILVQEFPPNWLTGPEIKIYSVP